MGIERGDAMETPDFKSPSPRPLTEREHLGLASDVWGAILEERARAIFERCSGGGLLPEGGSPPQGSAERALRALAPHAGISIVGEEEAERSARAKLADRLRDAVMSDAQLLALADGFRWAGETIEDEAVKEEVVLAAHRMELNQGVLLRLEAGAPPKGPERKPEPDHPFLPPDE